MTRRDTPEATVIELIQRANGNLQQLSLAGVGSVTAATLTALAANASPARFRALSIERRKSTRSVQTVTGPQSLLCSWASFKRGRRAMR